MRKLFSGILATLLLFGSSGAFAQENVTYSDLAASEADPANTAKGLDEMGMPKTTAREDNAAAQNEDTVPNEAVAAEDNVVKENNNDIYENENNVRSGNMELMRPAFMLPPDGAGYETAKLGPAIAGTAVGFVGMALNLSLGISVVPASLVLAGGSFYVIGAINTLTMLIMAPVSNALSKRSGVWSYYNKHKSIDTAAWTMFGLSVGLYAVELAVTLPLLAAGFWTAVALISTSIVVSAMSIATMAIFGVKGLKCIQMAKYAKQYNNSVSNAANDDAARRVMLMPSIVPVVSENNKITGSTLGISAVF